MLPFVWSLDRRGAFRRLVSPDLTGSSVPSLSDRLRRVLEVKGSEDGRANLGRCQHREDDRECRASVRVSEQPARLRTGTAQAEASLRGDARPGSADADYDADGRSSAATSAQKSAVTRQFDVRSRCGQGCSPCPGAEVASTSPGTTRPQRSRAGAGVQNGYRTAPK